METKTCRGCLQELEIEHFNWKDKTQNKRQTQCVVCTRKQGQASYRKNSSYYIKKNGIQWRARKKLFAQRIWDYLKAHPCVDCGEHDPVVLEFHHQHQAEKKYTVSIMVSSTMSWPKIEAEIEKCVVLCANCHRRRTAMEFGWYTNIA